MSEGTTKEKPSMWVYAREVAVVLAVIALVGVGWRGKTWFSEQERKLDQALDQSRTALVMLCSIPTVAAENRATCADLRPVEPVHAHATGAP